MQCMASSAGEEEGGGGHGSGWRAVRGRARMYMESTCMESSAEEVGRGTSRASSILRAGSSCAGGGRAVGESYVISLTLSLSPSLLQHLLTGEGGAAE